MPHWLEDTARNSCSAMSGFHALHLQQYRSALRHCLVRPTRWCLPKHRFPASHILMDALCFAWTAAHRCPASLAYVGLPRRMQIKRPRHQCGCNSRQLRLASSHAHRMLCVAREHTCSTGACVPYGSSMLPARWSARMLLLWSCSSALSM
jgi:hypothetical protein